MRKDRLIIMLEIALVSATSYVLSLIPFFNIGNMFEIYIGLIPLIIFSYRREAKPACIAGFCWGLLKILTGRISALSPLQVILEYLVAFSVGGISGVSADKLKEQFRENNLKEARKTILYTSALSIFVKYFIHFLAGYVFWASYAPEGMNPWIYTLLVNGMSAICTWLITSAVIISIGSRLKKLIII